MVGGQKYELESVGRGMSGRKCRQAGTCSNSLSVTVKGSMTKSNSQEQLTVLDFQVNRSSLREGRAGT